MAKHYFTCKPICRAKEETTHKVPWMFWNYLTKESNCCSTAVIVTVVLSSITTSGLGLWDWKAWNQNLLCASYKIKLCWRNHTVLDMVLRVECDDVLSWTYGPMGRVLPLWSRPPGPQISLSIVSVPRFPLSPTNKLFLISCFDPSSWGKVPPLGRKGLEVKGCSHHPRAPGWAPAVQHLPCQGQPNAVVCKSARRREVHQKGFLCLAISIYNHWGRGQMGLVTKQ